MSLLSAIRSATRSGAASEILEDLTETTGAAAPAAGAPAGTTEGATMTTLPQGGAQPAASTALATIAAAAQPQSTAADGYKAAMDRIAAITAADGVKGDAGRLTAAIDLAKAAPDLSAEAVVAFVTTNVPAQGGATVPAPAAAQAAAYDAQRLAAAGLAQPGGKPGAAKSGLSRLVDAHLGKAD